MAGIRPAQAILNEIRKGKLMEELAAALHEATGAVRHLNKPAEVTLSVRLKPQSKNVVEPFVGVEAEVSTKLPKPDVEATIFMIDEDSNLTRNLTRQQDDLPFSIASRQQGES